ncbi:MAG: hypothetical protein WC924_01865 [Candidatus Gracilibacteria bacterium]
MFHKTVFISLGLASSLFLGCDSEEVVAPEDLSEMISDDIIEQSDEYIISQVGSVFFEKYISFNKESSQYYPADDYCIENPDECSQFLQEPNYLMSYSLKIPGDPYVDGIIDISLDEGGNVIMENEPSGIPNCVEYPLECEFPIDKAEAIAIAENAGLEKGIKEWGIGSVHWYGGDRKTYVWTISNTLTEGEESSATGQAVVIDANTGEVVGEILDWMRQS